MVWRRRGDHRVANPARQFFANVPDNFEPTRHGRAIGLTHANATAVLLANPQRAFDLMWERTIETACPQLRHQSDPGRPQGTRLYRHACAFRLLKRGPEPLRFGPFSWCETVYRCRV